MDKEKKISYRPDLKYTDEYTSDIAYTKNNENDAIKQEDSSNSLIEDLIEQGNNIQNMVDKLPSGIGDIIKDHLDPIIDFVNSELKDKELHKVPVELQWEYAPYNPEYGEKEDEQEEDKPIDDPDYDMWSPDDDMPIIKTIHTYSEIVEKEYIKNLYDLFSDYYSNLDNIVSNFWSILLYSIMNKKTSEIDLVLNNILLNSSEIKKDKKHLLDLSVGAQINRDMKLNYFSNNFDAEGSIVHLKQFKAVYELRLRYANINKNDSPVSRADQMSNNMLKSLNLTYSIKYDQAYESLYRYLKSSNTILEDSLASASQSMRAKQTLIDTKGVK